MQSVSCASQVFSSTVAACFRLHHQDDKAKIVKIINDWFDVMNSRHKFAQKLNKLLAALGVHWQEQEAALLKMLRVMENMVNNYINTDHKVTHSHRQSYLFYYLLIMNVETQKTFSELKIEVHLYVHIYRKLRHLRELSLGAK